MSKNESKNTLIYRMSYEEISRYDCGSLPQRRFKEQKHFMAVKPRLESVIQLVKNIREQESKNIGIFFEIKSDKKYDNVATPDIKTFANQIYSFAKKNNITSYTLFQSFDHRVLKELYAIDPSLKLGLLTSIPGGSIKKNIEKLGFLPYMYNPHYMTLTKKRVEQLHKMGIHVYPWTVNSKKSLLKLKNWGVDGIITDYPNMSI